MCWPFLHPMATHSTACTHQICKKGDFDPHYLVYSFTKWNKPLVYLIIHLEKNPKNSRSSSNIKQFVCYKNLKICHSSLSVHYFLVIAITICNLNSWVWYQIKTSFITIFKITPYPTSNFQNYTRGEWFLKLLLIMVTWWWETLNKKLPPHSMLVGLLSKLAPTLLLWTWVLVVLV
jgi:hypothetical protein